MAAPPGSGAREYATDELVVEWRPRLCYHSQNCVRALPLVFDKERRPWIDPTQATADEVEEAVEGCPSGALRIRRLRGSARAAPGTVQIVPDPDGPLLVRGPIRVVRSDGTFDEVTRAAFCRCGHSANKPFCDGSHRKIGFRS